jgi:serine/threonine-protein phosphatase 2A activator
MHGVLSAELRGASVEIAPYFLDSFGNQTRIDYGTGMTRFLLLGCS